MALIRVERKSDPLFLWIAGLILLALAIWGLTALSQHRKTTAPHRATAAVDTNDPVPLPFRQVA